MKALARFEQLIERTLEEGFLRLLRPDLQPVEIARRLERAMEGGQQVGAGKVYAPNRYVIRLNPADLARFQPYLGTLQREMVSYLQELARERDFVLEGPPRVELRAAAQVPLHVVDVQAELVDDVAGGAAAAAALAGATTRLPLAAIAAAGAPTQPVLVIGEGTAAVRLALDNLPATVGRGLDNAVVLEDRRVSRHHAQIRAVEGGHAVVDLGSTNGTFVNGERIMEQRLRPGDVISFGGYELRFAVGGLP